MHPGFPNSDLCSASQDSACTNLGRFWRIFWQAKCQFGCFSARREQIAHRYFGWVKLELTMLEGWIQFWLICVPARNRVVDP